jgi:3-methyladenine DNA glycosylase Mpg
LYTEERRGTDRQRQASDPGKKCRTLHINFQESQAPCLNRKVS